MVSSAVDKSGPTIQGTGVCKAAHSRAAATASKSVNAMRVAGLFMKFRKNRTTTGADIATAGQQLKKTATVFVAKALVSPYV
jgi:hypothetical protein